MRLTLNPTSIDDYRKFLRIKQLPVYSLSGRYEAVKLGRRFYGCEIKQEYLDTAKRNLAAAERYRTRQETLPLFIQSS